MIARARGFGMNVIAWSRGLDAAKATALGVARRDSPLAIAAEADAISVHVALTPQTRGLIGSDFFNALKPGALFINTSRGEVVDEAALLTAVREKGIRAGLDVFAQEPTGGTGDFTPEIGREPGVYGTHHIGASTDQAQDAIAAETVRIVATFNRTGKVPNVVNLAKETPAVALLVLRHVDRPGVLARALDAISSAHINVHEMENIVFEGAQAAVARIHLESAPNEETMSRIRTAPDVLEATLIPL